MAKHINEMSTHDQQAVANLVRTISGVLCGAERWFVCFGTLLKLVRDKMLDLDDDLDFGVITEDPKQVIDAASSMWIPRDRVLRDDNKKTLKQTFLCELMNGRKVNIDIFFWVKSGAYYWHCWDMFKERPKNGILSKYIFMGLPAECFDVGQKTIDAIQADPAYSYSMRREGTWEKLIPGLESEGVTLAAMFGYGQALDCFYPDWAIERDKTKFPTSRSEWFKLVKSCKHLDKAEVVHNEDYTELMEHVRRWYKS